jgi:hypothetical protein
MHQPEGHYFVSKAYHDCSYLQGNEGNIDPVHLSFLHRFLRDDLVDTRPMNASANGNVSSNSLFGRDLAPTLEVEQTDFGIRIFAVRDAGDGRRYVRVSNFIYPNLAAFPGGGVGNGYGVNWHVPIDDKHHWKFNINFDRVKPMDLERARRQRDAEVTPDYQLHRNKSNRYLQDREEMKTRTYIGVGTFFQAHDAMAVEGPGPIQDRTQEHTGSTDKAIVMQRLLLLKAISDIQEGGDPPHVIRDPEQNRMGHVGAVDAVVSTDEDWHDIWKKHLPVDQPAMANA